MSEAARSGGRPSGRGPRVDPQDAGRRFGGQGAVLRVASVVPFMIMGAVALIAVVSWVLIIVFGLGPSAVPLWRWAEGRPAGEVVSQVALAVGIALIPLGVLLASTWAALYGLRRDAAPWFWMLSEALFLVLACLAVAPAWVTFGSVESLGLGRRYEWVLFVALAAAVVLTHLRGRQSQRQDDDGV